MTQEEHDLLIDMSKAIKVMQTDIKGLKEGQENLENQIVGLKEKQENLDE